MTIQDLLKAVDELPWRDVEKLQERIEQRRRAEQTSPRKYDDLQRQLEEILASAQPVKLTAGTMDVDKLKAAINAMREGFTQAKLDEIADAMDEEYIKP